MVNYAIIVAGGSGSRMKTSVPKQFLELDGLPIVMHSIQKFIGSPTDFKIILCLPEDQFDLWKYLCKKHNFKVPVELSIGGTTRFQSVKNALEPIKGEGIVAIHDAVRPFINRELIKRGIEVCLKFGNAIPSIPLKESLRKVENEKNKAVDRSMYQMIQTPQFFRLVDLKQAYSQKYEEGFTDDATVLEKSGKSIQLFEGMDKNIKITYPEDLEMAKAILKMEKN